MRTPAAVFPSDHLARDLRVGCEDPRVFGQPLLHWAERGGVLPRHAEDRIEHMAAGLPRAGPRVGAGDHAEDDAALVAGAEIAGIRMDKVSLGSLHSRILA